ncbi:pyridoxamine 5'-phosphate oxidase family protein [Chloroflexota bacterium]
MDDNLKLKEKVLQYLREHNTMTIATAQGGSPWAASVFYANDSFTLYFLSDPESRHSKEIAGNPVVAVTVNEDYHDWRKIKGIQMEGRVDLITDEDGLAKAVATYVKKYSFTAAYLKLISSPFPRVVGYLDKLLSKLPFVPGLPTTANIKFYRMTATSVRFIDNEKGFGHHEECLL